MLENISYYTIFGKPLLLYLGVLTYLSFLLTASISYMNLRGIRVIPFKWHKRMAIISIALASVHGLLALLAYL